MRHKKVCSRVNYSRLLAYAAASVVYSGPQNVAVSSSQCLTFMSINGTNYIANFQTNNWVNSNTASIFRGASCIPS